MANAAKKTPDSQYVSQENNGDAGSIDHREELKGSRRMTHQQLMASLSEPAATIVNPLSNNGNGKNAIGLGDGTFGANSAAEKIELAIQGISRFVGYGLFAIALTATVSLPFILA